MKLLHTSDWHVGRTIRGRSRADEHRAVLAEIAGVAAEQQVDLVVVAGDQFDMQAPGAESEHIVWAAMQHLAAVAPVVVVAGNHDHRRRLEALRGLLAANSIHAVGSLRRPADGGVLRLTARDGAQVNVALLPFLHHRDAVASVQLLDPTKADGEYGAAYAGLYADYARGLTAGMDPSEVNVLVGHVTCFDGKRGGGEREAHSIERYCVDGRAFPEVLDYVALGHLHLSQQVSSAPPVRYSGAPLMMDFGESDKPCSVTVVEVQPGRPAAIVEVPLTAGRPLRTLRGTLEQVMAMQPPTDDPWLRVLLRGAVPAGVADTVREHFGDGVVDVRLDRQDEREAVTGDQRIGRPPAELFAAFLEEKQIADPRIPALFATLMDDELSTEALTSAEGHDAAA